MGCPTALGAVGANEANETCPAVSVWQNASLEEARGASARDSDGVLAQLH